MAKKGVKRPIDNAVEANKVANKQPAKKMKPNGNVPQKPKTPSVVAQKQQKTENVAVVKNDKKEKAVNGVKPTNGVAKNDVKQNDVKQNNVKQNGVKKDQSKKPVNAEKKAKKLKLSPEEYLAKEKARILEKKEKILAKRKKEIEQKNLNRRIKRQEEGQYKVENIKQTEAEIDAKIKEIQSRPELTKTAKRKLGLLQKKKLILDGAVVEKVPNEVPIMSQNDKRKLRKKVANMKLRAAGIDNKTQGKDEKTPSAKIEKKNVANKVNEDKKVAKTAVKVNNKNVKNTQQLKGQKVVKQQPKVENNDDDDEDDEEEEEDADSTLNTTEDASDFEDDEEEDDDDDDDEEEEADSTLNTSADVSMEQDEEDSDDDEEEADSTLNTSADVSMEQDSDDDDDDEEEEADSTLNTTAEVSMTSEQDDDEEKEKKKKVVAKPKAADQKKPESQKKNRYVLFVGNLAYTTNVDDLKKHFLTKCSNVLSVRIPLKPDNSPKGIAFIELTNSVDYEKALSLHNTIVNGRQISVQYSEGGSKKSGNRPNVVAKNKKLHALRKQGKLAGSTKDSQKRSARRNKKGPA